MEATASEAKADTTVIPTVSGGITDHLQSVVPISNLTITTSSASNLLVKTRYYPKLA